MTETKTRQRKYQDKDKNKERDKEKGKGKEKNRDKNQKVPCICIFSPQTRVLAKFVSHEKCVNRINKKGSATKIVNYNQNNFGTKQCKLYQN